MRYSTFDLDPDADLDELLERYERAGWHTWAPGRGAVIYRNGQRVRRVWLRTEAKRAVSGPSQPSPMGSGAVNGP